MRTKRHVGQRVENAMNLPKGTLVGAAFIELEGNTRAVISGCKGICLYSEDCVSLRTAQGVVAFYGRNMEMGCLSVDGAIVTGCLQRIEFGDEVGDG